MRHSKERILSFILVVMMILGTLLPNMSTYAYEYADGQTGPTGQTEPAMPWDGTIATEFAGGAGTVDDPYLISDGSELAYLSALIADPETNVAFTRASYLVADDIDMGGTHSFLPIGYATSSG